MFVMRWCLPVPSTSAHGEHGVDFKDAGGVKVFLVKELPENFHDTVRVHPYAQLTTQRCDYISLLLRHASLVRHLFLRRARCELGTLSCRATVQSKSLVFRVNGG